MKWIKASERLPEKHGVYFVKLERQFSPDQNGNNQVAHFTQHREWYLENHHHSHDFFYVTPFEWLDESDDADLQKAKQEIERLKEALNSLSGCLNMIATADNWITMKNIVNQALTNYNKQ